MDIDQFSHLIPWFGEDGMGFTDWLIDWLIDDGGCGGCRSAGGVAGESDKLSIWFDLIRFDSIGFDLILGS